MPAVFPRESKEQRAEERSRQLVRAALDPWRLTDQREFDNGIDMAANLTEPGADGYRHVTGHGFLLQLKAVSAPKTGGRQGAISLDIDTRHLCFWRNNPAPVMLVAAVLPAGPLCYRWIDDSLFAEIATRSPLWPEHSTVRIHLPTSAALGAQELDSIRSHVVGWRQRGIVYLPTGAYLSLYDRAVRVVQRLSELASEAAVEGVCGEIAALERRLQRSTYTVALAGPSRVGKSSLLNVLAGRDISPVDDIPATAVPVAVIPGPRNIAIVELDNGERVEIQAIDRELAPYVTKRLNPDNSRGVRRVEVYSTHPLLQPGIALLDVPGLDDLDEHVRDGAWSALARASAVIYLIDGSTIRSGGMPLNRSVLDDLERLAPLADRLLLVVNKAEDLTEDDKARAGSWMTHELTRRGVLQALRTPIVFGSVREAAKAAKRKGDMDEHLGGVLQILWGLLLAQGNAGVTRLGATLRTAHEASQRFSLLLQLRCDGGRRRADLADIVSGAEQRREVIRAWIRERVENERTQMAARIKRADTETLQAFERWLRATPTAAAIPSSTVLEEFVRARCAEVIDLASHHLRTWSAQMQGDIDRRVQDVLHTMSTPNAVGSTRPQLELPPIADLDHDISAAMKQEQPLIGLVIGVLFDVAFGTRGLAMILGLLFGAEHAKSVQRERRIATCVRNLRSKLPKILAGIHRQINLLLTRAETLWLQDVSLSIDGHIADHRAELSRSGSPPSAEAIARLEALHGRLSSQVTELGDLIADLNQLVETQSA